MAGGYGGQPSNMGMGGHDPSGLMSCRDNELDLSGGAYPSHSSLNAGMAYMHQIEAAQRGAMGMQDLGALQGYGADRGMGMYMPQQGGRGVPQGPPPGNWHHDMSQASYSGANLGLGGGPLLNGPLGTDPRRFPRGRMVDDGLDASRMGAQIQDPNLAPWMGGGLPEMPYGGQAGIHKAYLDRMADGIPSHLGVQCGGGPGYGEY